MKTTICVPVYFEVDVSFDYGRPFIEYITTDEIKDFTFNKVDDVGQIFPESLLLKRIEEKLVELK